jgi:negative regulator of flagellin synthesis FlgM
MKVYTDQNKVAKSQRAAEVAPAGKKDEVILSTQAQEFGQIYQAIKAMPEVREDKIRELSERIAQGNYSVDAKEVAEKMLGRIMADRMR